MAVGRFQVMAVLQAARATELGLPKETAFSWGLNRAIFYAAAKRGFKGAEPSHATGGPGGIRAGAKELATKPYQVGNDFGYSEEKDGKTYFVIGGKPQAGEDFEKQIQARFGNAFPEAWKEALYYVHHFDRSVLLSGNEFFSTVYRPKRDEFATRWTELSSKGSKATIVNAPVRRKRRQRSS